MTNELDLTFDDASPLSLEEIDCSDLDKAIGLFFASGYNTTNISFEAYDQNGNAYSVNGLDGAELEITVSQTVGGFYPLDPAIFAGINKFRVRRGTVGTPYSTAVEDSLIKVLRRAY
jgi:hypothetical protein